MPRIIFLLILCIALITTYLTWGISGNWQYIIELRLKSIAAACITGAAIGTATLLFHTLVNNRIVTPQILGLDSIYELSNTLFIYLFGSYTLLSLNDLSSYAMSVCIMLAFAIILYRFFFYKGDDNIYYLLLVGLVSITLFSNLNEYLLKLMDPSEYQIASNLGFGSFNNVKVPSLILSAATIVPVIIFCSVFTRKLDVLLLGRDHAINLGLNYEQISLLLLILVAISIASATALSGPMVFLGILVLNITLDFLKTHYHRMLLPGIILVSICILMVGQFLILHVFNFATTLSSIINLLGGICFFWILIRENRK